MHTSVEHKQFDRLVLGLVVVVCAIGLTYVEAARTPRQALSTLFDNASRRVSQPAQPKAAPTVTTTTAPAVAKTATTTSLVHVRSSKSVSSGIVTDLQPGTVVQLREDADATWQGVTVNGKSGYIYRDYLQF